MFKQEKLSFPGFKYEVCYLREMTIAQARKVPKAAGEDGLDILFYIVENTLFNEAGDHVISDKYTIDEFAESVPQSYINLIAEAIQKLNSDTDEKQLEVAKNS